MAIVENKSRGERIFNGVNIFILLLLTLIFFYPLWHCLMASFSDPGKLLANSGALLWPAGYSLRGYEAVLSNQNILTGYQNTLFYVIVGTSLSTVLTLVGAYALTRQGLMLKKPIMVMIVITMYIGGGMIPDFMVVSKLGLFDSRWSVILATAITTYNLMVMRTAFLQVPHSLEESAMLDGANDFVIFVKLILPLLKPALATIGLFLALSYWNSWYACMLYISDYRLYTLQYYLYNTLNKAEEIRRLISLGVDTGTESPPSETMKFALTCVATGPIILLYPFVQKYFVKGITIGAVKG